MMNTINVWNRTSNMHETSDFYVHVSADPFASNDLATTLADPDVESFYISGDAGRPTALDMQNLQGQYVRVQLTTT